MPKALILHERGETRIVIDGRAYGPKLTMRAAKVILRWMNEGGLEDFAKGGTPAGDWEPPKIGKVLASVDRAFDDVKDLLTNGLK
jgi:hypothetical protein